MYEQVSVSAQILTDPSLRAMKCPMPLNRLGMLLKKAGYRQKCLGGKVRGWIVYEREAGDVRANRTIQARS